ncbi:hypothetical protein L484_021673 [Morus notabilis]|uniref:Transmembrane protein n=1 Tax=Morus notabilis TaxID=981085 RepID=W9SH83_9ROSA|nr:uncharacterized protein LOC21404523 [Morus notabilis]EXC29365.1 hypothetical protein L484_021673 [Morus notabilis]
MGFFFAQTLMINSKSFCPVILLFLLLLLVSSSSSLQTKLVKTTAGSVDVPAAARTSFQVFYIKNTSPFFLDGQREPIGINKKRRNKTKTTMMMRRKNIKNMERSRPNFSGMLPKGFVPPSGSSPCHNENPNSVVFFCDLGSSKP